MYLKIPANLLKIIKISWKPLKLQETLQIPLKFERISLNSSKPLEIVKKSLEFPRNL